MGLSFKSGGRLSCLGLRMKYITALRISDFRYSPLWLEAPPNMNLQVHVRDFMIHTAEIAYLDTLLDGYCVRRS